VYVDGKLVNETGSLFVAGNQHLEIDHWIRKDGSKRVLRFVEIGKNKDHKDVEEHETQNGLAEVRFYKAAPQDRVTKETIYEIRPIYIERTFYPFGWDRWWDWPYVQRPWLTWESRPMLEGGGGGTRTSSSYLPADRQIDSSGTRWDSVTDDNNGSYTLYQCSSNVSFTDDSGAVKQHTYSNAGATVNGREVFRNEIAITEMPTVKEPVVLTMKLFGYVSDKKVIRGKEGFCAVCGEKFIASAKFCSACGNKRIVEITEN